MNYTQQVKTVIGDRLNYHIPRISDTASALSMSSRTLSRKLTREKTRFKQVAVDHIMTLSVPSILHEDFSIEEVSSRAGYANPGSFIKAFYRWSGKTPHQYRMSALALDKLMIE